MARVAEAAWVGGAGTSGVEPLITAASLRWDFAPGVEAERERGRGSGPKVDMVAGRRD